MQAFVNDGNRERDSKTAMFKRDAQESEEKLKAKNKTAPQIAALAANEYYKSLGSKQAATTEHQVWKNITQHG